jgi:O-methyltransferase involved in polyketide biosynthesis
VTTSASVTTLGPRAGVAQLALPRTAVRLLAACATSCDLCPELGLDDAAASRFFEELGGERAAFTKGELRCAAFRVAVMDQLVEHFFERHPRALAVGLWPVLGTRSQRLSRAAWLDIDAPPVSELRARFLPQQPGHRQLGSCLCGAAELAAASTEPRLIVMDESVLPLSAEVMMRVLDAVSRRAARGTELVLAHEASARLRPSQPERPQSALELQLATAAGEQAFARYPRLRVVSHDTYSEGLSGSLEALNVVSNLQGGVNAPGLVHLVLV